MRALLVRPGPRFSVEDVAEGYLSGLRDLGVQTQDFAFGEAMEFCEMGLRASGMDETDAGHPAAVMAASLLRAACYDFWPDLVVVVTSFFVPPSTYEILRARGVKVAVICTESPYEDDAQVHLGHHADAIVVNDPTNLERFREVNPNTDYLPHASRPDVAPPRQRVDRFASDFCFVGTGYPSRVGFFEQVDFMGADVTLAGNWQSIDQDSPLFKYVADDTETGIGNDLAHDYYASTRASANIYRTESQRPELAHGWAMGPREVELAAAGTFFLTEARGENREVLPMVPTFDGPGDFSEKLRWWLDHPTERAAVALKARAAIADRTFTANAQKLLHLAGF